MKTTTAKMFSVALTACFVMSMAVTTAGCFSKGKKGYICKRDSDCQGKLRCRTFRGSGKKRRACVSSGTRRLSSGDTYTKWAVYGSWGFVFMLPLGVGALVFFGIRNKRKQEQAPPPPPVGPSPNTPPAV